MATDNWDAIAVPVMEAVADAEGSSDMLNVEEICAHAGFDFKEKGRAVAVELERLVYGGYIGSQKQGTFSGPEHDFIVNPHLLEPGARAVGRWPSRDPYEALLQQLERAADGADDPQERAALKKVASTVGDVGQGVLTGVLTAFIRGAVGLP